jgi:hypothetical protein
MITFSCIKRTWQKPGSFYVFEKNARYGKRNRAAAEGAG